MKYVISSNEYRRSGFREMSFLIANAFVDAQEIINNTKNNINDSTRIINVPMYLNNISNNDGDNDGDNDNADEDNDDNNDDSTNNLKYNEENADSTSKIDLEKTIKISLKLYSEKLPGVSITNYTSYDSEDLEKTKFETSKKIKFMLAENNIYQFKYKDYDFTAEVFSLGTNPINESREFYKELHINSDAPYNIIENFAYFAEEYHNKNFKNIEDNKKKILLRTWDSGFYELINTLRPRSMKNIYFPEKELQDLINDFDTFLSKKTKNIYLGLNIPHKRNYLLEGRWGTGKTSLIHALASKYKKNIAMIPFNNKVDDGTLLNAISNIPENSVLVLEDIDCLFQERKKNDGHKNQISFSSILNMLDGLASKEGLITFMTTNYKTHLDEALIRPGRIDKIVHFDYAKKEQFSKMFYNFSGICKKNDSIYKNTNENHFTNFWNNFQSQRIKVTTGLLSQYMLKYINNPEGIIHNTDELKKLHSQTNKQGANMHI